MNDHSEDDTSDIKFWLEQDGPHIKWTRVCEHGQTRKECFRCIVEKEASFRDLYNLFDRTDDGKD